MRHIANSFETAFKKSNINFIDLSLSLATREVMEKELTWCQMPYTKALYTRARAISAQSVDYNVNAERQAGAVAREPFLWSIRCGGMKSDGNWTRWENVERNTRGMCARGAAFRSRRCAAQVRAKSRWRSASGLFTERIFNERILSAYCTYMRNTRTRMHVHASVP